jgi:hypothetical protein
MEVSVVIEPAVAIIVRASKQKAVIVALFDIHQAIPTAEIELLATLYTPLTVLGQAVDLPRPAVIMGTQLGDDVFGAFRR